MERGSGLVSPCALLVPGLRLLVQSITCGMSSLFAVHQLLSLSLLFSPFVLHVSLSPSPSLDHKQRHQVMLPWLPALHLLLLLLHLSPSTFALVLAFLSLSLHQLFSLLTDSLSLLARRLPATVLYNSCKSVGLSLSAHDHVTSAILFLRLRLAQLRSVSHVV